MIEPRERSEIVAPHITQQRLENGGFQRNADSEFCISVWRFKAGIKSAEGEIYQLYTVDTKLESNSNDENNMYSIHLSKTLLPQFC